MIQLIFHLIGDYVTQSNWMAENKTKAAFPAWCHAFIYSLPFMFIASTRAWMVIYVTHFLIDRYRLARYVVWFKNLVLNPTIIRGVDNEAQEAELLRLRWRNCSVTGAPSDQSIWLAVWLMIICDNTLHLTMNFLALRYL